MTQQDETSQGAATDESAPSRPSPYLDAGESVPQAYLAPPQPDQPKYGSPPPYRPGLRQRGSAQQPYAQPGTASSPGYGQRGYGQRGRPAARRHAVATRPGHRRPWERLAASMLDWIIIFVVSVLAFWSPLARVSRELDALMTNYQQHSSPAAQAAINNLVRQPANQQVLLVLGPGDVRHRAGLLLGAARRLGRDHRQACSRRPGRAGRRPVADRDQGSRDPRGGVPCRPRHALAAGPPDQRNRRRAVGSRHRACRCSTRRPSACTTSWPARS